MPKHYTPAQYIRALDELGNYDWKPSALTDSILRAEVSEIFTPVSGTIEWELLIYADWGDSTIPVVIPISEAQAKTYRANLPQLFQNR